MSVEFPISHLTTPFGRRTQRNKLASPALRQAILGRTWLGRIGRAAAAVAVGGVTAILAVQFFAYASAEPKGLMYDVGGGRRMRLVCEGPVDARRPTVIFESGAFGFSGDWANVQPLMTAQGVRSCAYDRAGMGLSDPSSAPRDGANVASDLEKLLAAAHVEGPLVLVGHSMAGSRLHLYANRNPGRVQGLVFVDTTPSEAMSDPIVRRYVDGFAAGAKAAADTAPSGILRLLAVTSLGDKVGLPPEESLEKRWQFGDPTYERTAWLESRDWPVVAAQALKSGPIDPRVPVAVVSAGVPEDAEGPRMQQVQPAPALASDHGYIAMVPGATHHSILTAEYAPWVIKGVDFVLKAARPGAEETRVATVFEGQTVTAARETGRSAN
ncbi:MAG TPA: alpha/beta hydrolase [Caulobacteraceae bacterium]|jgi:pimeloyl-ACP methyl ester carboxylesterase